MALHAGRRLTAKKAQDVSFVITLTPSTDSETAFFAQSNCSIVGADSTNQKLAFMRCWPNMHGFVCYSVCSLSLFKRFVIEQDNRQVLATEWFHPVLNECSVVFVPMFLSVELSAVC